MHESQESARDPGDGRAPARLDAFQRLALTTTVATYLLIAVGALVRAAGAGLGCPDWPKCFDRWIPPVSVADVPAQIDPALFNFAKAWTEYVNRLLGVSVGFLIFATLMLAIRHHRRAPNILWPTVAAFVLVGVEGWIGGKVVATKLSPIVLTMHLVFALLVVSSLLFATFSAFFPGGRRIEILSPARLKLARGALLVLALALLQLGLGALLRGEVQLAQHADLPRAMWLSSASVVQGLHRAFAGVVATAVLGLYLSVEKREPDDRRLRQSAGIALVVVLLQVVAGVGLDRLELAPALQVVHLALGSLLLGALTVVALVAYRLDPRGAGPSTASGFRPGAARAMAR